MNTIEFLDLILPTQGLRCVVAIKGGVPSQRFGPSNAWLADAAATLDNAGFETYHACATYKDKSSRQQANAAWARSFWLDVDAGPGKPFADWKEATRALMAFVAKLGLPQPLVVKSGRGIHTYFVMDADMSPEEWTPVAGLLKLACREAGFKAGPERTGDIASILRPPGTTHRKGEPLPVLVVMPAKVVPLQTFWDALATCVGSVLPPEVPVHLKGITLNNDLVAGQEFPPSSAELIADKCAVMAEMRETRGNVDQPTWYGALGVLVHTREGEDICHDWSDGHPTYSEAETDKKIAQALKFGPTTCAKLSEAQYEKCSACPHFGKITSPIVLGHEVVEPVVEVELAPAVPATATAPAVPAVTAQLQLPFGYRVVTAHGRNTLEYSKVVDEVLEWTPFCDTLFYPVARIDHGEADGHEMELEMIVKGTERRRFKVPHGVAAEGGRALAVALGKHEIVAYQNMKPQLENYMAKWVTQLRDTAASIKAYDQFGWNDAGFLVGTRLMSPAGGEQQVILKGHAIDNGRAYSPLGSFDVWKALVDRAYNYEGQEAMQFQVLCALAAPVFALFGQYGGVTVFAHSEGSGIGKTTAQRVGLSGWGDWYDLQLAEGKVTANYLWTALGTHGNLPVMYDELTNLPTAQASDLVYSVSSGKSKRRLQSSGQAAKGVPDWSTILLSSGNNLLSEKLAHHHANPDAELSRLFEFTVHHKSRIDPNEAADLFPLFREHCGHAGPALMRFVVDHREQVVERLKAVQKAYNTKVGITQKERYWSALHAAVLTTLELCRKLDIVRFEAAPLFRWLEHQVRANRAQREGAVVSAEEQFGRMMADLQQGVLVTEGKGDLRKRLDAKVVGQGPRGTIVGRVVIAVAPEELTRLYLNDSAVREWCTKRGISKRDMFDAGVLAGWIEPGMRKMYLGFGTLQYTYTSGQLRCWVVDPQRVGVEGISDNFVFKLREVSDAAVAAGVSA